MSSISNNCETVYSFNNLINGFLFIKEYNSFFLSLFNFVLLSEDIFSFNSSLLELSSLTSLTGFSSSEQYLIFFGIVFFIS